MSRKIKRTKTEAILFTIVFIFFIFYSAILIYPLLWGATSSLKDINEYYDNLFGLPRVPQIGNYFRAFKEISDGGLSFSDMFWNSLWFGGGSAIIYVECLAAYAYVLNKYKFRGRNFLYNLCLFLLIVPFGATFVGKYRLIYRLGIANSYLILLSATGVYDMNLIIMHAFISNISRSYMEAAQIDGANFYQIYFKTMRPQIMPMMLTIGTSIFISKWNDYMSALLFLPKMPTLMTGLFRYQVIAERTGNYPVLFSGLAICAIPIFLLYGVFNKKLIGNISIGGLKG